ncbi:hypothetical protein J2X52_002032 [Luteimonas sp. 3794]|nr:hypothetical protein [Luteimonas sp. 3794]
MERRVEAWGIHVLAGPVSTGRATSRSGPGHGARLAPAACGTTRPRDDEGAAHSGTARIVILRGVCVYEDDPGC